MTSIDDVMIEITPQVLLKAYACGIFPMAESADDNALYWIEPERRGILPLDRVHVPRRLVRTIRQGGFEVRVDNDFEAVIDGCAAPRAGRRSTWINGRIRSLYADLFALGHCHTVEVWDGDELIGGLYGVHLGRAFFGESMFSRARDASKIALIYLVARLKFGGFELLDTQFLTGHLARFGAIEVGRAEFQRLLEAALYCPGNGNGNVEGGEAGRGRGFFRAGAGAGAGAASTAGASAAGASAAGASAAGASAAGGSAAGGGAAAGASAAGASPAGAAAFWSLPAGATGSFVLQLVSQTSKTGCSTA
jgi:leucyl/phenylalanyl-tRNA--protein transferase